MCIYTDDKAAQIALSLLKAYGVHKIVVSPGTTNAPIAGSVQDDPFFEAYSVVDERSAAYFAVGLSYQSGEPVVISCTGATASRNYLPGLTEAYYRNIPIIALTSQHWTGDYRNLEPQVTNRSTSQEDIKRYSVMLPIIKDKNDERQCITMVNNALIYATTQGRGPVHINHWLSSLEFSTKSLPDVPNAAYYTVEDLLREDCIAILADHLRGKSIGVFIGAHYVFPEPLRRVMDDFIQSYDVAVLHDHTSNYRGKNSVLISVASDLKRIKDRPDLVIDMGSVTGEYTVKDFLLQSEFWRISEDGELHQRWGKCQTTHFAMSEGFFFSKMAEHATGVSNHAYYSKLMKHIGKTIIPELPLSNTFISQQLAAKLPAGCSLHVSILNSLRNIDYFNLDPSINFSCNVGGFGIDGSVSTVIGQSMVDRERLFFGIIGDLAFFYDMNSLGIRHIRNNLRLLVVNNGEGAEFHLNPRLEAQLGDKTGNLISARGHFGSVKAWAVSMGFEYITADCKKEFSNHIDTFCSPYLSRVNRPILFEVFTRIQDEKLSVDALRNANRTV